MIVGWLAVATMLQSVAGPGMARTVLLEPVGRWTVKDEDSGCVLSREFGSPSGTVKLELKPILASKAVDLMLSQQAIDLTVRRGNAIVTSLPGGPPSTAFYVAKPIPGTDRRMSTISLTDAAGLLGADSVTVRMGAQPTVGFATVGMADAIPALDRCQRGVMKRWNIDPDYAAAMVTPAEAQNEADWIGSDDYPPSALRAGEQGSVLVMWTIGVDAKVHDCRILASSGNLTLDTASCSLITLRGRYLSPAIDKRGQPIVSYRVRRINWLRPS